MRRANLLTLRKFFNWKSTWCSKFFYKSLLYKDLFIQFYLNSLFFKLRFNTSSIRLNYMSTNIIVCTFDIYINSLRRLKRYNNFFFKKISKMYDYVLIYLDVLKNNKISSKTFKPVKASIFNNFKLVYLNFFFYIFKYKKKNNLKLRNNIKNVLLNKSKFKIILYDANDFFYNYNDFSKSNVVLNLVKFNSINKIQIKLEYYYNIVTNNYTNSHIKNLTFVNLIKLFNYNFIILPYNYLKFQYFFFTFINNFKLDILNSPIHIVLNLLFYYKNIFNNLFLFSKLVPNLFFKTINLNKLILNKNNFNSVTNNFLSDDSLLYNGSYKRNSSTLKFDLYNIKSNFFFFININLFKNFKKLNGLLYLKKIKKIRLSKIKNFISKLYIKWGNYDNRKNYLFIFWIFKRIWFKLFNNTYINYIYKIIKYKIFLKYKLISFITNFLSIVNKYFYLFNFKKYYLYSLNFIKNMTTLTRLKRFILVLKFDTKIIKKYFKYIYMTSYLNSLFFLIEKTLVMYTDKNANYILTPNIFLLVKPFINSAKLICDYLYFKLRKKLTINNAYNKIRKWQLAERSTVATSFKIKKKVRFYPNYNHKFRKSAYQTQLLKNTLFRETLEFRAPLRGIRCLCSGPPYKAKRKLRNFYHVWVANFNLTGWMPLQQSRYQIDYYQTFIVLKRATIGLKVWILLESYVVLK